MKKLNIAMVVLLLSFLVTASVAQEFDNAGTSAANFLKIGIGSRANAMGGAFIAQANDVSAVYWNVAGLASIEGSEMAFSSNDWIADVSHYFVGGAFPMGQYGKIGVELIYLDAGSMRRTSWEDPTGLGGQTFDANDFSIGVAYARDLTDRFRFGIKGKYITQKISFSTASAIALDFGTQYDTGFRGMTIGMSIQNFGTKMKLSGSDLRHRIDPFPNEGSNPDDVWALLETEEWSLPVTIRIGVSMELMRIGTSALRVNADFVDYRDIKEMFVVGGEYSLFNDLFFLRGGVSSGDDGTSVNYEREFRMNFGAGFMYKIDNMGLGFDYSYSDLGVLTEASRYSVRLTF